MKAQLEPVSSYDPLPLSSTSWTTTRILSTDKDARSSISLGAQVPRLKDLLAPRKGPQKIPE